MLGEIQRGGPLVEDLGRQHAGRFADHWNGREAENSPEVRDQRFVLVGKLVQGDPPDDA